MPFPIQLRPPTVQLAGCCWLPRFSDKARLLLAGKLPLSYRLAFCSALGIDGHFLKHFGLTRANFLRGVRHAKDDDTLASWFLAQPTVTAPAIAAWNEFAPKIGAKGRPGHLVLLLVKPILYSNLRGRSVDTIFEMIAQDEGTGAAGF